MIEDPARKFFSSNNITGKGSNSWEDHKKQANSDARFIAAGTIVSLAFSILLNLIPKLKITNYPLKQVLLARSAHAFSYLVINRISTALIKKYELSDNSAFAIKLGAYIITKVALIYIMHSQFLASDELIDAKIIFIFREVLFTGIILHLVSKDYEKIINSQSEDEEIFPYFI